MGGQGDISTHRQSSTHPSLLRSPGYVQSPHWIPVGHALFSRSPALSPLRQIPQVRSHLLRTVCDSRVSRCTPSRKNKRGPAMDAWKASARRGSSEEGWDASVNWVNRSYIVHVSSIHFLPYITAFCLADCLQFIEVDLSAVEWFYAIVPTSHSR